MTLIAILLFAAVNLLWSKTGFGLLSALDYPHQTWTGTAVDDFLKAKKVRLNEAGGTKFLDTLAAKVTTDGAVQTALAPRCFDIESMLLPDQSMVAGLKGTGL